MRRLLILSTLAVAACAGPPRPTGPTPPTPGPKVEERGELIGRSRDNLLQNLGPAALEVREGDGLKLQWRGQSCVLDAYLYPPEAGGTARAAHVDARDRDGRDVPQAGCIAALLKP